MLKKALLHPPFPRRAKTDPRPSFVLASLGGSTYKPGYAFASLLTAALLEKERVLTRLG
jgi:hypothetical protein